ncbi:MAG: hypothetical protein R6U20_10785 [Longimonas sp.]|uniref:hypothetical protein n=1 Tax=Longimonas sp. TaxID=2039626 RepID=UPI003975019F
MRSLLTACLLATGLALLPACGLTGPECGPFETPTSPVVDFDSQALAATQDLSDAWPRLSPIEEDTLTDGHFAIYMQALHERRAPLGPNASTRSSTSASWSLIPTAHACSPPPLAAVGTVSDLRIYSSAPLFDGYTTDDNLAPLFDIAVRKVDSPARVVPLETFLDGPAEFAREIALVLTETPRTTAEAQFTVEYRQDDGELESYTFTTNPVVIEAA